MNEQEKELSEFIGTLDFDDIDNDGLAKAIIQRYPQITKKPVKIKLDENEKGNAYLELAFYDKEGIPYGLPVIFDDIKQRQEWLDSHYVEVVE